MHNFPDLDTMIHLDIPNTQRTQPSYQRDAWYIYDLAKNNRQTALEQCLRTILNYILVAQPALSYNLDELRTRLQPYLNQLPIAQRFSLCKTFRSIIGRCLPNHNFRQVDYYCDYYKENEVFLFDQAQPSYHRDAQCLIRLMLPQNATTLGYFLTNLQKYIAQGTYDLELLIAYVQESSLSIKYTHKAHYLDLCRFISNTFDITLDRDFTFPKSMATILDQAAYTLAKLEANIRILKKQVY